VRSRLANLGRAVAGAAGSAPGLYLPTSRSFPKVTGQLSLPEFRQALAGGDTSGHVYIWQVGSRKVNESLPDPDSRGRRV
jgi:hypothetical protein